MNDSLEITRISNNLSLRLSPERKYPPKITSCPNCFCFPCQCCPRCHYLPCRCCHFCHCCPCICFIHSPPRYRSYLPTSNSLIKSYSPNRNLEGHSLMSNSNFSNYHSPKRPRNPNSKVNNNNSSKQKCKMYEQKQFNDFLRKLMLIESNIERIKIDLSFNPDFNCEDAFRLFENEEKEYLDKEDLQLGLNLLGLNPTDHELRLLMKRFDLQKKGGIDYADFFDIIIPFEKEYRLNVEERIPNSCCNCRCLDVFSLNTISTLRELFYIIINYENEINNMRKTFGTLRIKLRYIFELLDNRKRGYFTDSDLLVYLKNQRLLKNDKDADLLFIRLDKNRNGKIDYKEVEDEVQTLY